MSIKVILTGATGLVGEGVLLACLNHPDVAAVLMVNRKPSPMKHPKLKEIIVSDFMDLRSVAGELAGYDACFYCAGISSRGLNEKQYAHITYDTTLSFAKTLLSMNTAMTFCHISGAHTDSSEQGKIMWARVKGKAENALARLPFKKVYNFRPGFMKPSPGQQNIKGHYKIVASLYPVMKMIFPKLAVTLHDVGLAMINSVTKGYAKPTLEVDDIKLLARQ